MVTGWSIRQTGASNMDKTGDIAGSAARADPAPLAISPAAPSSIAAINSPPIEISGAAPLFDTRPQTVAIAADMIGPQPARGQISQPASASNIPISENATLQGWRAKIGGLRGGFLAASVALASALGALAGSLMTAAMARPPAPPAANAAMADLTRAWRDSMARLQGDVIALAAKVEAGQHSAGAEFGRLAERLDRAEKAQGEPAARLARIAEALDRLERRPIAAAPPPAQVVADVTGSISAAKREMGPPPVEGWQLLDFYGGRAVVESRSGRLFEVGPGSNLPGLGRVEAIKRENGRVVVVTAKGIIAGPLQPARPPYYLPYR
jgi:hypothetical protein